MSIVKFLWENDIEGALEILKRCRGGVNDPVWRFNEAFLYLYSGNYKDGLKRCFEIKKLAHSTVVDTSFQTTEFCEQLIENGDQKPELLFWLGFNYCYVQNNLTLTQERLESYLKSGHNEKLLTNKAEGWLQAIKSDQLE